MVLRRNAPDFLERRHALESFVDSDHAQRPHAFADRLVLYHRGGRALDDQTPDRLAHRQRFNERHPAEITPVLATVAAASMIKDSALRRLHPELLKNLRLRHELFPAIGADAPNESLRARHDD